MKRYSLPLWFLGVVMVGAVVAPGSVAQASAPHYVNGMQGLGLGTLPPPGFYYRMYNLYYSANQVRKANGDKLEIDKFHVSAYMNFHQLIWTTKWKILGGNFVTDLTIPFVYTDMNMHHRFHIDVPGFPELDGRLKYDNSSFGLSDIDPEFMISYNKPRFDFAYGFGLILPTGRYSPTDPTSPGKGYLTFKPCIDFTYYFDKARKWTFSTSIQYEINTRKRHTSVTPGQNFHFEYAFGRQLGNWQLGLVGYHSWQTTRDKGTRFPGDRTQQHAVGGEISLAIPKIRSQIQLRSNWEFKNRATAQGNMTALNFTYMF